MTDLIPHTPPERSESGVTAGAGVAVFGGILLGLAITTAFDTFFRHASEINTLASAQAYFMSSLDVHLLKLGQLFVFLFTAVRFYWGTYRYHEEIRSVVPHGPHFIVGMFGAILVFSGFYVTAIYVTNVALFYLGFLLFHLVDFIWFVCILFSGQHKSEMKSISKAWIVFDVATIAVLALCVLAIAEYPGHFWVQGVVLGFLVAVGITDLSLLWDFYTDKPIWHKQPFRIRRTRPN